MRTGTLKSPHLNSSQIQLIATLADSMALAADSDNAKNWHKQALSELSAKIQRRLQTHQNPDDCSKAKYVSTMCSFSEKDYKMILLSQFTIFTILLFRFLVCDFNKACGLGCQLHHLAYCLTMGAALNRTVLLEKNGAEWKYSPRGWSAAFEPLSNCSNQVRPDFPSGFIGKFS